MVRRPCLVFGDLKRSPARVCSRAGSQRQNYLSPMRQQRCTDGNLMLGNVRHESYLLRENSESVQIDALVGWND
jgi:hypothetical protein